MRADLDDRGLRPVWTRHALSLGGLVQALALSNAAAERLASAAAGLNEGRHRATLLAGEAVEVASAARNVAGGGPDPADALRRRVDRLEAGVGCASGCLGQRLASVRAVIDAMGGHIGVTDGAHGGARFGMTLPLLALDGRVAVPPAPRPPPPSEAVA